MIAPEGYIPVSTLLDIVYEDNYDEEWKKYCASTQNTPFAYYVARKDQILFRWIYEFICDQIKVYSPDKGLMNVDQQLLFGPKWNIDLIYSDMQFKRLNKFDIPEDIASRYNFSNPLDLNDIAALSNSCLLYTSPSPRDKRQSRMPSSA